MEALIDPKVSEMKFNREIEAFRELEDEYRQMGWWMLRSKFPDVTVVFASSKFSPPSVIFGVDLNFENYDLWPPSVRLVNPFTRAPIPFNKLPTALPRLVPAQTPPGPGGIAIQNLMVAHQPDQVPFLCLPGVREYHEHPAHSGDSWLLHRGRGEGTLHFILNQLYKYGVEPLNGYAIGLSMTITGYNQGGYPQ